MAEPARRRATWEDLLAAPEHLVAELIDGELFLSPRPAARHALSAGQLAAGLVPRFGRRGGDGPGGWWILAEPELHLGVEPRTEPIVVPDLAGWRRERMPRVPDVTAFTLPPDWVCEVLSPRTGLLDRTRKLPIYARCEIPHVWLVDPIVRTLEVLRLEGRHYAIVATHGGDEEVRAEPFEAAALELSEWWLEQDATP